MKYIKYFESEGETPIELDFGPYVKIKSLKSKPLGYDRWGKLDNKYGDKGDYNYFTKVREINIYIDNKWTGSLNIDERGFNHIMKNINPNFPYGIPKTSEDFTKINNEIEKYLIDCHNRMKASNPEYGEVNGNGSGRIPLLTHHFFEYVKKDFENSALKEQLKDLPLYIQSNKYNI